MLQNSYFQSKLPVVKGMSFFYKIVQRTSEPRKGISGIKLETVDLSESFPVDFLGARI